MVRATERATSFVNDHILLSAANFFLLVYCGSPRLLLVSPLSRVSLLIAQWFALVLVAIEAVPDVASVNSLGMSLLLMRK